MGRPAQSKNPSENTVEISAERYAELCKLEEQAGCKGLTPRKSGIYAVRVHKNGNDIWRSTKTRDYDEAVLEGRRIRSAVLNGDETVTSSKNKRDATIEEVIRMARRLAILQDDPKAIETWQTYAGRLRLIADAVNAETVVELQGAAMYIRNALGDQRKQVTKESYLRNAAALFCPERLDAYSKMGFDLPDPFEGLKIKRNFRTSYTLPPPDKISQLRVLLNDLRDSDILAFRILAVALATGARSQEIAHLHWQDISASSITIQPDPESQWEPKSHQERTIPADPLAMDALFATREITETDTNYLLPRTRRERPGQIKRHTTALRGAAGHLRDLGEPFTSTDKPIHLMRKRFTSYVNAVFDVETARDYLGHSSITTTQAYLRAVKRDHLPVWLDPEG